MSSPFARMTSDLLVRKGDASPSVVALPIRQAAPHRPTMAATPEPVTIGRRTVPRRRERADGSENLHHIRVTVTTADLQRIGIAAVKTGGSRQQVIHAALQLYFSELAEDLDHTCSCMVGEPCQCTAANTGQADRSDPAVEQRPD